jgi:hypothetical protein
MLQNVYGDEALSYSSVSIWFQRFEDVREDLQDDQRSGSLSTSRDAVKISNVCEMATRGRRWALRMISDELNINKEAIPQYSVTFMEEEDLRKFRPTQTHG